MTGARRVALFSCVTCSILVTPAHAFGPEQRVDDGSTSETIAPVRRPHLAIDADDVLHVAFPASIDDANINPDQIFYTRRPAASGEWLSPNLRILSGSDLGVGHVWVTLHGDDVVVGWPHYRPDEGLLVWIARLRPEAGGFDAPSVVPTWEDYGEPQQVRLLSANGNLYALWTDASTAGARILGLAVSPDAGKSWTRLKTPWPAGHIAPVQEQSTVVDAAGALYVAYVTASHELVLWVSDDGGTTWPRLPIVIAEDRSLRAPDVAVATDGTIGVVWTQELSGPVADLVFARVRRVGSGFQVGRAVQVNTAFPASNYSYADLEVSGDGTWHVSVNSNPSGSVDIDIYYTSSSDGIAWLPGERVNADPGHVSTLSSLVVDSDGFAHIVYGWGSCDFGCSDEIRYATNRPNAVGVPDAVSDGGFRIVGLRTPTSSPLAFSVATGAVAPRIGVFDVGGRRLRDLTADGTPGRWSVRWDLRDVAGRRVDSGVYLIDIRAGARRDTRKLVVVD